MRPGTVLIVAVLVTGCARWGAAAGEDSMAERTAMSMEVKVSASSVRMVLHVTNRGDDPIALTFPTSQRYDFLVQSRSGDEVWRWSDGMGFLQAISQDTLGPGESWDMEAVWDPGTRTGQYIATGIVMAGDHELQQTAAFELE